MINPYTKQFTNRMKENKSFDVYDVCNAYELDSMRSHAVKKLLVTGGRSGGKSELQDLQEARWTLDELIKEVKNEASFYKLGKNSN